MKYATGHVKDYREWPGRYANQTFTHFAKHHQGRPITYDFNSQGFRGPEFHDKPDLTVIGSSFSFGVGIQFCQCWHQLLGNLRVNCYATAGFPVNNHDLLDLALTVAPTTGRLVIQFRESEYGTVPTPLPQADCFTIDHDSWSDLFTLEYDSIQDRAEDGIHPGPLTHQSWARTLKDKFGW